MLNDEAKKTFFNNMKCFKLFDTATTYSGIHTLARARIFIQSKTERFPTWFDCCFPQWFLHF